MELFYMYTHPSFPILLSQAVCICSQCQLVVVGPFCVCTLYLQTDQLALADSTTHKENAARF